MLHVVTRENRHLYSHRLEEMFRMRYDIFVGEQGWDLDCKSPFETDQFDTDDAIYFLYFDREDEIAAIFRLLPTTVPHMLSEVFPSLCFGSPPIGNEVFEGSRVAVRKQYRKAGIVWQTMMAGIYEYCLLCGIERLTGIFDLPVFMDRIKKGVDFHPLGVPTEVEGELCIAFYRPITVATLQVARQKLGLSGPVLTYIRDLERAA